MSDDKHRAAVREDGAQSAKGEATSQERKAGQLQMTRTYLELRTALMRFAYRYFKTSQEIEDVVQEAFVKVIEAQQKREILHPKSYIYQTVKNLSLKRLDTSDYRLTDTVGDILPESVLLESATLEDQFESQQRFELFCQAVRQLPVKCQRVYIMRRVYGYSQKQIAEKMGITVKTVEAHLSKAIMRCTDYMDDVENTQSDGQNSSASQTGKSGRYHG